MSVFNFQDLYCAYLSCRRKKRKSANTQRYEMHFLDNVFNTLAALQGRNYQPQQSLCFVAKQPKIREIHAADFSDRVVHHWLVSRLEALYEPVFIYDVYSNRKNKATHKAVKRLQSFMCSSSASGGYFLQLDIANFFNTIDRSILFRLLQGRLRKALKSKKIDLPQAQGLRHLTQTILKADPTKNCVYKGSKENHDKVPVHKRLGRAGKNKGLPIGNLTSQFFANVYLNELDQYIKHQLKCRYYVRYVDDFVILGQSPTELAKIKLKIDIFLEEQLKLSLREQYFIKPVTQGADFLGYIVRPHYCLVRRRVVGNLRSKLNIIQSSLFSSDFCMRINATFYLKLRSVLASYWGHFVHASSYKLKQSILFDFPWLLALYGFSNKGEIRLLCLPDESQFGAYRTQIKLLRSAYPFAQCKVQRGLAWDCFTPLKQVGHDIKYYVDRIIVKELNERYKCGLKKRFVSIIEFNRGFVCH